MGQTKFILLYVEMFALNSLAYLPCLGAGKLCAYLWICLSFQASKGQLEETDISLLWNSCCLSRFCHLTFLWNCFCFSWCSHLLMACWNCTFEPVGMSCESFWNIYNKNQLYNLLTMFLYKSYYCCQISITFVLSVVVTYMRGDVLIIHQIDRNFCVDVSFDLIDEPVLCLMNPILLHSPWAIS